MPPGLIDGLDREGALRSALGLIALHLSFDGLHSVISAVPR